MQARMVRLVGTGTQRRLRASCCPPAHSGLLCVGGLAGARSMCMVFICVLCCKHCVAHAACR
eukprot:11218457-Lingulodinium_polyedra.AAC.1